MNIIRKKRTLKEAEYIINTSATIRDTAKKYSVSKSTVAKDLTTVLPIIDLNLYQKIIKILKKHNDSKHIKGGIATQLKYKGETT
jgi:putative DeoR family transcriptional regulator (stage III sporulation protein D)